MTCPSEAELRDLLDGRSTAAESLSAHIALCPACQTRLEEWTSDTLHGRHAATQLACPEPALAALVERLARTPPPPLSAGPLRFPGPATPQAPLGQVGGYQIIQALGGGGGGLLFQARDTKLDRLVALKVLRPELAALPAARLRFEREARAAASLQHPHIVTIHDVAAPVDFPPYLVMELIAGESLADLVDRQGVLAAKQAAGLAAQAAEGLAAAHSRGLVHRDVKPGNVLFDRAAGRVKVVDFGLAHGPDLPNVTHDGQIVGTPAYMSPEQAAGWNDQVDARTDVYGLGATLYYLLTGRPPFAGSTRSILTRVIHQEPESPRRLNPHVPADLETIVLQCLAKEPGRRYATAADLAADLHRFLRGEPVHARPVGKMERLVRWCRRNRALAAASAAAGLLLIAGAAAGGVAAVQYQRRHQATVAVADRDRTLVERERQIAERDRTLAQRAQRAAERDRMLAQLRLGDENYEFVNYETARVHYRQAMAIGEALLAGQPSNIRCQEDMARALEKMGDVSDDLLDFDMAMKYYERSVQLSETVLRAEPNNQSVKESLALVCGTLAEMCEVEEQEERAETLYRRSDDLLDELIRTAKLPERAAELAIIRADQLCFRGKLAEAAACAEQLRGVAQNDGYALFCAACCYAKCTAARGKGVNRAQREQYAQQAFTVMREAIAAGYDDHRWFQKDPDWKALREHAQFQATVDLMRKRGK